MMLDEMKFMYLSYKSTIKYRTNKIFLKHGYRIHEILQVTVMTQNASGAQFFVDIILSVEPKISSFFLFTCNPQFVIANSFIYLFILKRELTHCYFKNDSIHLLQINENKVSNEIEKNFQNAHNLLSDNVSLR